MTVNGVKTSMKNNLDQIPPIACLAVRAIQKLLEIMSRIACYT